MNNKFLSDVQMKDVKKVEACDNETALALLKKFHDGKWNSVVDFLPAIKNGMMVLDLYDDNHDTAISYYKQYALATDYKPLSHGFVYGLLYNKAEYKYALPAYSYLLTLNKHVCNEENGQCTICHMFNINEVSKEKQFIEANNIMYDLCVKGEVKELDFNSAVLILKHFRNLEQVTIDTEEDDKFLSSLELIKDKKMKYDDYVNTLYSNHYFEGSKEDIKNAVNMLIYLEIINVIEDSNLICNKIKVIKLFGDMFD